MKYLQCNDTLDRRDCACTLEARLPYADAPALGQPALPLMRERGDDVLTAGGSSPILSHCNNCNDYT